MTLLSSKASLQSEEIAPCIIYTHLEESLLKWEIKTGTRSWEAGNENILPPYWKTSWISVVASHYWQRRLMFPTLSSCLKGIQHFLMQLIEIFYLLFSCDQKQDFVNLLRKPFSENVKAEKSRYHRMDTDKSSCLQTWADSKIRRRKGLWSHQKYFSLSYFFIRKGKIKCSPPVFVITMINFI